MIKPKFCFTIAGYRKQAETFEDVDLLDCITNYRDQLGSIRSFLAMYGILPKYVEEFSEELLRREIKRDQINKTSSLEKIASPIPRLF